MDASIPRKRPGSPRLIPNPFIKKKNLLWTLDPPDSNPHDSLELEEGATTSRPAQNADPSSSAPVPRPTTAAVESGAAVVDDHLAHFSENLAQYVTQQAEDQLAPRLAIDDYAALYKANAGSKHGAHFVIHQHDHPVAGTHYDLRLQINETSSVSWAIMYGLPGDPNSVRLNRNATETRIHSLWNHLIETASADTGSLMIWDTGTYSILPRRSKYAPALDPDSGPSEDEAALSPPTTQQSLLHAAFQTRKIKIRLHGTKLPDPVVGGEARQPWRGSPKPAPAHRMSLRPLDADIVPASKTQIPEQDAATMSALEKELRELEDEEVRRTNAYKGATNSIGSIHQRKWFLSLERNLSGFQPRKSDSSRAFWLPKSSEAGDAEKPGSQDAGARPRLSYPFYVKGRDFERSVITGRLGAEILHDEGAEDFVPRMGWNPVTN
ncbi:hypothetical protein NLG97_g10393 [Lecanicillium saksenae]|uniref:Uncharacterized protein n=1 Tax=Lecanicillium saksenae TaxID=468837 RepID=A0ACC1QF04_9HYPO|nr:hypothetical protein NLG97_g10393 [Lecanicillium saksenae]